MEDQITINCRECIRRDALILSHVTTLAATCSLHPPSSKYITSGFSSTCIIVTNASIVGDRDIWIWYFFLIPSDKTIGETRKHKCIQHVSSNQYPWDWALLFPLVCGRTPSPRAEQGHPPFIWCIDWGSGTSVLAGTNVSAWTLGDNVWCYKVPIRTGDELRLVYAMWSMYCNCISMIPEAHKHSYHCQYIC